MKPALIFDFGGVLMKTKDHTPRHRWDAQLGLPPGSVERIVHGSPTWIQAQTGIISPQTYWQDVGQQLNLAWADVERLREDFYSGDVLDANLIAYIEDLRAGGHAVALLSNDSLELVEKLARLGIAYLFDPVIISAQIGVMKPDPRAYQYTLEILSRPPQQTIFIDDRQENVSAARALGIQGVHYVNGMNLPDQLAPLLVD